MISAVIILTLLSVLVSTEPEEESVGVQPPPEPPLRPAADKNSATPAKPDRLAA
ncbi:MAG: hypothetical protein HYX71_04830 [Opitutae bacterium]|nr:hypothetical protein [Opitutae bacterium]